MYQVDKDKCTFCAGCSAVCPSIAIIVYDSDIEITPACTRCGFCACFCPVSAIQQMKECNKKNKNNLKRLV